MKMKKKSIILVLSLFLAINFTFVCIGPAAAEEDTPSADFGVDFLSAYIWRGQELSKDSLVIQPSVTVGWKGFAFNAWANLDTDPYVSEGSAPSNLNETDLTFSYARSFGPVGVEVGYIYYGLDAVDDSQEFFVSLSLDTLLSPTLTIYREVDHYQHWYLLFGIGHSFGITENVSLDLSGNISYLVGAEGGDPGDVYVEIDDHGNPTDDEYNSFHDATLSASLPISFAKYFTVAPVLSVTFPVGDDASNHMKYLSRNGDDDTFVYGGVSFSFSF